MGEPSLAEMAGEGVEIEGTERLFLMVEGGLHEP
jgi:hypothetical protein